MSLHLQAIVTVLALINPAVCAAIFFQAVGDKPRPALLALAARAALTVLVILVLAALFGARILNAFGVSLDAFSVAGGGVLASIGLGMLRGPAAQEEARQGAEPAPGSLTPLILFAASPGTITGVITLAVAHSRLGLPLTALVAVGVGSAVLWSVLLLATRLGGRAKGDGFVRDTVTRYMGLIVIAMGVQFALTGWRAFMHG